MSANSKSKNEPMPSYEPPSEQAKQEDFINVSHNSRELSPEPERSAPTFPSEQQILQGAQEILTSQGKESFGLLIGRAFLNAPFHPIRLVQVLIQLGHEPTPPQRRFSFLFQQHMYYYPGIISYSRSIIASEGWRGLYRGVTSSLLEDIICLTTGSVVKPMINSAISHVPNPFQAQDSGDVPDTDPNPSMNWIQSILTRATRMFVSSILTNCIVEIVVHPFHVISIRTMAQYIGKETTYNGTWSSIKEIYSNEGLSGFYSGLAPALLGHLCTCIIHSSLWLMFEVVTANITNDFGKALVQTMIAMPIMLYIPRSYSYPLFLMSNVMAVNNIGLAAGSPPRVPVFGSWRDCYRHLKASNSTNRGAVVVFPRFAFKNPCD